MATKRTKKTILSGVTRDQMEEAFGAYASADAEIAKITAEMDKQFTAIREKHAERLAALEKTKEENFEVLNVFASEHKDELFSKKKSLESAHGTIGFRTGTPKLKTLKGFTWASALQLVKQFLPGYVRTTDEIAKDKLLADRELEEVKATNHEKPITMFEAMAECGIKVDQDETFFVEPKKEEVA